MSVGTSMLPVNRGDVARQPRRILVPCLPGQRDGDRLPAFAWPEVEVQCQRNLGIVVGGVNIHGPHKGSF